MKNYRGVKSLLTAVLLVFGLLVNLQANGQQDGEKKQTLSFITWRGDDSEAYDEIIAAFEAENPNITVNVEYFKGGSTYDGIVSTRGIGGELDLYAAQPGGQLASYVESDFALDISDQPFLDRIIPGAIAAATIDGKTYGVSEAISTMCVFYNTAMFKEYGLSTPKTWEEFLNICDTFKANGVTPLAAGLSQSYIAQNYYKMMVAHMEPEKSPMYWKQISDGKMSLADEPNRTIFKAMESLFDKGYYIDGVEGVDKHGAAALFAQEQVAMVIEGTWRAATIAGIEGAPEFGIFSIPFMGDPEEMINVVHPNQAHLIFPQSKNIDAALKFYDFLMTKESETIYSRVTGSIPTVVGTEIESPVMKMVAEYISSTRPVLGPNLGNPNNEVYSELGSTFTMVALGTDTDQVIKEMQAKIDAIER
jgi:raffinose/stachyose/melibiose transport system substrate-binding protein